MSRNYLEEKNVNAHEHIKMVCVGGFYDTAILYSENRWKIQKTYIIFGVQKFSFKVKIKEQYELQ